MGYTRETLYDLPISKLVDIILSQQDELERGKIQLSAYEKIRKILNVPDAIPDAPEKPRKGGRPALSEEERAAAYERQKARQKEKYWARKEAMMEKSINH